MHVELVPPAETLVAQLTFERLLAWMTENRGRTGIIRSDPEENKNMTGGSYQCGFSGVAPCLSGHTASEKCNLQIKGGKNTGNDFKSACVNVGNIKSQAGEAIPT